MAFNFPSPANVGDTYSSGGATFQFDGVAWNYVNTTAVLAYNQANAAYTKANSVAQITFGTVIANGSSIIAASNNDTLTIIANANVSIVANTSTKNITFDLTDTGVTYTTYGNSTIVPVFTVDNKGRLRSAANATIDTTIATAAFAAANTMVMKAGNTMTGNLVFSGANITFLSSTVAFPNLGIYFSNTPTVGIESAIYANSANILVFATRNTERVRIDASGKLNVGTIDIVQFSTAAYDTSNAAFGRANSANLIANLAYDKANSANLAACGAFAAANTMVMKAGNTMTGNLVFSAANITFLSSAVAFSNLGIYFSNTPTSGIESAIYANAANVLVFATNRLERMRIENNGRVGIGTGLPNATMQIAGNVSAFAMDLSGVNVAPTIVAAFGAANTMVMKTGNTMTGNLVMSGANITFLTSTVAFSNLGIYFSNTPTVGIESAIYANASNTLVFATRNIERVRIDPSGNVGIGNTVPVAALDVSGSFSVAKANVLSQTLTYGANAFTNWDTSLGQVATVTLTGTSTTLNTATNLKVGTYILHVIQDGTGGRLLTFGSGYKFTGAVAPVLTTSASARDMFSFVSDGTNLYGAMIPDVR